MQEPMRIVDRPQPGLFKLRRFRGGPWVAARIRRICLCTIGGGVEHDHTDACDRRGSLTAEINGVEASPDHVWNYGRSVSVEEYERLLGANPSDIPLSEQPPVF